MKSKFNKNSLLKKQSTLHIQIRPDIKQTPHKPNTSVDDSFGGIDDSQLAKLIFLSSINLFTQMSQNRLKDKLYLFKEQFYERGSVFFKEDDQIDSCWLIISGEVQLSSMVQIPTLKDRIRVKLAICIAKTIFGEGAYLKGHQMRLCKAEAVSQVTCYKISMADLSYSLHDCNLYDQFVNEFDIKEKYWHSRIQQISEHLIKIQGENKKVIQEVDTLHQSYEKQVTIPKRYNNFIPASKLIWKQRATDINKELLQAHADKDKEVQKLMNFQVRKQFKGNFVMRRLLIGAYKRNIHIEVMDGLHLSKYVDFEVDKVDRIQDLMDKYRSRKTSSEDKFQFDVKDTIQYCDFKNAKLQDLKPKSKQLMHSTSNTYLHSGSMNQRQLLSLSEPMGFLSASSIQRTCSPLTQINKKTNINKNIQNTITDTGQGPETALPPQKKRPMTASVISLNFSDQNTSKSAILNPPKSKAIKGKNSKQFFEELFKMI